MRRARRQEEQQDIDISPLIDMVFILLIFFMVSTTFQKDMDLDIDRPQAGSAQTAASTSIRIYVAKDGTAHVDGQPVRSWMLQSRVKNQLATAGPEPSVLVVADETIPSKRLIEVVDQARLAGAVDVGVATEAEAGK